jgi:hypothetical protein
MLLSITLLIVARINHFKADLKVFLVIIGYALIVMFIMQILLSIFYLWIPTLYVYVDTVFPPDAFQTAVKFSYYVTLLSPIWSLALSAIGVSAASKLPMSKSITIALLGFLPYYLLLFLV